MCAKCKHNRYDGIELPNFDDWLSFEKMCLNVGLQISSKIIKKEKQITYKIDVCLSKLLYIYICPEDIYITT